MWHRLKKRRHIVLAGLVGGVIASTATLSQFYASPAMSNSPANRSDGIVRYVPDNLFGVSFVDDRRGWAAGYYGTLLVTSDGGVNWTRKPVAGNDLIRRTRFLDARTGWIVTHRGRIMSTEDGGTTWVDRRDVPGVFLRDVAMLNREVGWVVGHNETILHTTDGGDNWLPQQVKRTTQDPPRLNGVAAFDANTAVVVGEFGSILITHDGGVNWASLASPIQTTYTAVAAAEDHAVAVGLGGAIIVIPRDGGAIHVLSCGSALPLFDVALDRQGRGLAVGAGGACAIDRDTVRPVIMKVPGGAGQTWLGGVALVPGRGAVTVGGLGFMGRYNPAQNVISPMPSWTKPVMTAQSDERAAS